ncbi:phosphate-starvation-inducible PsiE family protein [Gluconacetobacter diazotrophicus]|uniref:phosphate-starvation-inducible PsiE family protein n=1 Tax=Gluconacetobacter diazotrophicus TaxID=33996 RepID=UPI0012FEEAFD|nr:phosphate-starvation-inducible PsiE family protein [Gluconacetobacter diazotrophicus]
MATAFGIMLAERGISSTTPENLQAIFGMFFTILIALEFKRSFIMPSTGKQHGIIRIEPILLIGMLATVRARSESF